MKQFSIDDKASIPSILGFFFIINVNNSHPAQKSDGVLVNNANSETPFSETLTGFIWGTGGTQTMLSEMLIYLQLQKLTSVPLDYYIWKFYF
jgi:hypothetical protein